MNQSSGVKAFEGKGIMMSNPEGLIADYFNEGKKILSSISVSEVTALSAAIEKVRVGGFSVFIAGNGGSASTASHFATDIGVGSLNRSNPVRVISLCDNSAVLTAIANDTDYKFVFEQQIRLLAVPGDLLIVISASGNSENLINAVLAANDLGIPSFSITGFDGGKLKEMTQGSNVHVESNYGAYGLVEDAHLAICHVVTECVREHRQ